MTTDYAMPTDKDLAAMSFEQLLERLEQLNSALKSPEVGIERLADLYDVARIYYAAAGERLDRVAERFDAIDAADEDTDDDDDTDD
jgi:exonuclease VII small subunit